MTQHADVKTARIAAEKAINSAPTAANHAQLARLNELEVKIADLKVAIARINAAGGVLDANAATALSTLISQL
jgi:hypothetical protein